MPTNFVVAKNSQFDSALGSAISGDTITLADGYEPDHYFTVNTDNLTFAGSAAAGPVTLEFRSKLITIGGTLTTEVFESGSTLDQTIIGGAGENRADVYRGHDIVDGGLGNDLLHVGYGGADAAHPLIFTPTLAGTSDGYSGFISLDADTDIAFDNIENFLLQGGAGDDILGGGDGADELWSYSGIDQLSGGGGADELHAGTGDGNRMRGGLGADLLQGDRDDDIYVYGAGEAEAGETLEDLDGIDTLEVLGSNDFRNLSLVGDDTRIERLVFASAATATFDQAFFATSFTSVVGNADVNAIHIILSGHTIFDMSTMVFQSWTDGVDTVTITGFAGNDDITGGDVAETIIGGGGRNIISGGGGNDIITGGGSMDIVDGGAGNDTLTGGGSIDLLSGGAGNDTISGGDSADLIDGDADDDTISGGAGADNLGGGSGSDRLNGDAGSDILSGDAGNDTLSGGLGWDTLSGDAGLDIFLFNTAPGAGNVDTITDFSVPQDTIRLENSIFTALGAATGKLAEAKFFRGTVAHDTSDRIIYNPITGWLIYDKNGSGAGQAIHFATLDEGLAMTRADFFVI